MSANVIRMSNALRTQFFFLGVLIGGWSTRIPEVKTELGLNDATLGRVLMGSTLGIIISSQIIGWLMRELGAKKVFYLGSLIFPVGYLCIAFALNAYFLFIGAVFFVIGYAFIDNPITMITQDLEKVADRKFLSGFHAFWCMGTLVAAFFGSFLIGHVPYPIHLSGLAVISFSVLAISGRTLEAKETGGEKMEKIDFPWFGKNTGIIWAIGFGMLCASSAEFGATDWSALFLRDVLGVTGQFYVGAFMAFEIGMITSRLLGDKYIHSYGPEKVIKTCGFVGSVMWLSTMLLGVEMSHGNKVLAYVVILLGYLVAGLGVGPMYPALITIVGRLSGVETSVAFARCLLIALLGFAVVPGLIGHISDLSSLNIAMLLPITLLGVGGYMSRVARSPRVKVA
jgi:MFS family permease